MDIRADEIQAGAPRAAWLAGVVLLLGGLFGMHGLESHGAPSGVGAGDHVPMVPADSDSHARTAPPGERALASAGAGAELGAAAGAVLGPQHPFQAGLGAAGLCMAVLVLTLIAFLMGVRGRRLTFMRVATRPAPPHPVRSRDPDPPSLVRLSVHTC